MSLITNLVAGYRFEGNSNDVMGTYNGTDSSMTYTTSDGKISKGAHFAGGGNITTSIINTTTYSISMWLYPLGTGGLANYSCLLTNSASNAGLYYKTDTGKISMYFIVDHLNNTALTLNAWNHIGVSVNAGAGAFYLNGVASGTGSLSAYTMEKMGNNPAGETFNGSMDEVYIWSRALDASEFSRLYNNGNGLAYPFSNGFFQFFST